MKVLVTGADGFIGKNLVVRLSELPNFEVIKFVRGESNEMLLEKLTSSDAIIHLAGENRPANQYDFQTGNVELTAALCEGIRASDNTIPMLLASSVQSELDNPYGESKRAAETLVTNLVAESRASAAIYRLPGVFGKWCRPNYNSVVATFCHNIARGMPLRIDDPEHVLNLVFIDDVIDSFIAWLGNCRTKTVEFKTVEPMYQLTVGELAAQLTKFSTSRSKLEVDTVGSGLVRALYSTYITYLATQDFTYPIKVHGDQRGIFVEMLKTPECGQLSYFTAKPGVTRGGHYHHAKIEKFLVVSGEAKFRFKNIITDESFHVFTSGGNPVVVETVPGWSHDITNSGNEELVVMLWANERFDPQRPDTFQSVL